MTKENAKAIFELYNSKSDVVRCPNGRAIVRKQLDAYAKAAVNLYGIISFNNFIDIFNNHNVDQTNPDELYTLLLPLVLKNGWYCFYKENIVHYTFFENLDHTDHLLEGQADKPHYIPEKDEFLKYIIEDYADNDHWWNVRRFMMDIFGYSKASAESYEEIKNCIIYGDGLSKMGPILDRHDLIFQGEQQLKEFIDLITLAKNNTRIWENNGYTPTEMAAMLSKRNENIIPFPIYQRSKVGRNDPCPCGSGKKYKKCCGRFSDTKTAQLSSDECRLFYETWYGLMGFVNERKRVINAKIMPEYPNSVNDMMIHKVREVLWEKPELIDTYIHETELSQEKIDILKLWRTNHKKGMFFILDYQPEYAVVLGSNQKGEDRLYGIKGISNSVASTVRRDLPTPMETVLLPFKGKIIYDSFMSPMLIGFAEGAKLAFRKMYDNALKHGVISNLDGNYE